MKRKNYPIVDLNALLKRRNKKLLALKKRQIENHDNHMQLVLYKDRVGQAWHMNLNRIF
jgi:hypothetical protein